MDTAYPAAGTELVRLAPRMSAIGCGNVISADAPI
jgi:hypothetical protein